MKIKGYTLHGDYYLADKVIPNKNYKDACEMKEIITLPNGKKVIAHTLSRVELETISRKERGNIGCWYWTSTIIDSGCAWYVLGNGVFHNFGSIGYSTGTGGARLGFHKNEIKQFLDIE